MSAEAQAVEVPEAPEQTAKVVEFVKAPALTMSRFGQKVELCNEWKITTPMGVSVEQVMDESYWANVSMHLKTGDIIEVMPDNGAWELSLRVLGSGPMYSHVIKRWFINLEPATPKVKLPSRYKIEHAGAHHKWRFLRDGEMMKDGFETEALAQRAAANHESAVNR